ncbi:hypothetical protein Bca4012_052376 [Brassica carinata]|uniref:Uncharacterized protein n=3 Tax=Brassica TaxID=3705 RepID=A0A8X7R8U0_BRACI|nr:uncharacterized protein LOC106389346 isoform X2 [Brassica napus]XP_048602915.1 uncharacterized protein LOC106389346 isoform X2 [Brassica napus]KAG2283687.1 hypothetical protein Bca52824_054907 [Brassica carinata]
MSPTSEIDQVWNQMQHGMRRMRPLVVEQQPERDMRFPKPAMVVQERCSRSPHLEWMEKYWTERWIEITLAGGTSMEEIEEIRAFVNYDRPVRTLEEERKARLEMLEECRRMIERDDEEDAAKKSLEEETFAAEDSDLGHVEGSLKSFCPLMEPIQLTLERKNELADDHQVASQETQNGKTLICWDQKVEPYFERGKDASKELLETKREKCAHQGFEQMAEGDVRVTKKKKRWKQLLTDIEKKLAEIWSYEESDKSETLEIQMEYTSNRQRKCLMELCKRERCQWVHTRERVGRKWLLMFRKKKRKRKKRTENAEKNYGSFERSRRCKEAGRAMLRNIIRCRHNHERKYTFKGVNELSVEIKISNDHAFGGRLLLNVKTKKRTRLWKH